MAGACKADHHDMRESSLMESVAGRYHIQSEIGRGGMGTVYLGHDTVLDRQVAVKMLAPHLAWDREFVDRFMREARTAARLDHPNIVTIHDVGQLDSIPYLVMQYMPGETLESRLRRRGILPLHETLHILRSLAGALDCAHSHGVIHRDVKPANVILGPAGRVTLTDFGVARAAQESRLTNTGASVGTPQYISPEQLRGSEIDVRADQYSLGVVAYQMLTGHLPFEADNTPALMYQVVHEPPPPIARYRQDLPDSAQQVLNRALAKDPRDRYRTVTEFVGALEEALSHAGSSLPVPPPAMGHGPDLRTAGEGVARNVRARIQRPGRHRRWVLPAAAVVLVVVVLSLLWPRGPEPAKTLDEAYATQTAQIAQLVPTEPRNRSTPPTRAQVSTPTPIAKNPTVTVGQSTPAERKAQIAATEGVFLRSEPNEDYTKLGWLPYEEHVMIVASDETGTWFRVRRLSDEGVEGWVSAKWVELVEEKLEEPATATPTATSVPTATTAPRSTPTTQMYAALPLISPAKETSYIGPRPVSGVAGVELRWIPLPRKLEPNEWYVARIWWRPERPDQEPWPDHQWTQDAAVVLPDYLYEYAKGDRSFRWSVAVVRLEGGDHSGKPDGKVTFIAPFLEQDEEWSFIWKMAPGSGGPDPTPTAIPAEQT